MQDSGPGRGIAIYFIAATVAMIWPVYPFFSRIEPRMLGLPFSLAWILFILVLSFFVISGLYLWESRTGRLDR